MENEIWMPIKGFEDLYEVSNYGRIKSLCRIVHSGRNTKYNQPERMLALSKNTGGYFQVGLNLKGKVYPSRVHRLVAAAFLCNPENCPVVNHLDGDINNNRTNNLEWCTQKHNIKHASNLGRLKRTKLNHKAKFDRETILQIRNEYASGKFKGVDLAKKYGVAKSTIHFILNKRNYNNI